MHAFLKLLAYIWGLARPWGKKVFSYDPRNIVFIIIMIDVPTVCGMSFSVDQRKTFPERRRKRGTLLSCWFVYHGRQGAPEVNCASVDRRQGMRFFVKIAYRMGPDPPVELHYSHVVVLSWCFCVWCFNGASTVLSSRLHGASMVLSWWCTHFPGLPWRLHGASTYIWCLRQFAARRSVYCTYPRRLFVRRSAVGKACDSS